MTRKLAAAQKRSACVSREPPLEYDDLRIRFVPADGGQHRVIAETPDERAASELVRVAAVTAPLAERGWLARAEAVGAELFASVFQGSVRDVYMTAREAAEALDRSLRLRVNVTAAPELVARPWELLFDEGTGGFLAVAGRTSLVRSLDVVRPVRVTDVEPPLRILAVAAAPSDWGEISAGDERAALDTALADHDVLVEWVEPPTLAALTARLGRRDLDAPHVLHFAGHGALDEGYPHGVLVFEDSDGRGDAVEAPRLAQLVEGGDLRLVVLNACRGAVSGSTDAFTGVAAGLVRRGIPAVIGMAEDVADRAAVRLAARFYEAIARGASMETALADGRAALLADRHDVDVGLPVLFLRGAHSRLRAVEVRGRSEATRRAVAANNVAIALGRRGEGAAAVAAFRLGADLGSGTAANNLGIRLKRGGNQARAIEAFRRGMELGHPAAANNLGLALEGDERIRAFARGAELGNPKAANNLGVNLWRVGRHDEAIDAFEQAIGMGNGHAANNLAIRYRDRGDTELAIKTFRQAAEAGHPRGANNLGRLLLREGKIEDAVAAFERAVELGHEKAAANLQRARRRLAAPSAG